MKQNVVLDTGPLVALLDKQDRFHSWAETQFSQIAPPLLTCESVVSEACHLLGFLDNGRNAVMDFVSRGVVDIQFQLRDHIGPISALLHKYRTLPISFADACLIRMSEVIPSASVFTLDSDFSIYRRNGRHVIPTIRPSG